MLRGFYLEHTQGRDAFWRGLLQGRVFLGQWGKIGTQGQIRLWRFDFPSEAQEAFEAKYTAKIAKGYREVDDPLPPEERQKLFQEKLHSEPLEIFWKITESGVTADILEQAAGEARDWLLQLGAPGMTGIHYQPEGGRGHVLLRAGNAEAHFGFPPKEVLEAQVRRGVALDLESYPSFQGWLSWLGKGQGVIETSSLWLDLPVRLFLARLVWLAGKQGIGIVAEDSYGNAIDCDLTAEGLGDRCPWIAYREELLSLAAENGWVRGRARLADGNLNMCIGDEHIEIFVGW